MSPCPVVARLLLVLLALAGGGRLAPSAAGAAPTFNRDIAPIVWTHCAPCHRPGETAPFDLLTYQDVRKHAQTIVRVTQSRYMPPWLPEPGHEPLVGERRLTDQQIATLAAWAGGDLAEGDPADLPPAPKWTPGWVLGPPDLILQAAEPYTLAAEGPDVYRNLILPVPTKERRYVRAFEFRPGSRAVHHAFLRIDATGESRKLDARDPEPGFPGMTVPPSAETPGGQFLSWQPGRLPTELPPGLGWPLAAGADVVLLMHLQLRGRVEEVRPSIGLYFTDQPPTNTPVKVGLQVYTLDIPAGATNYAIEDRVTLTTDADLLALLPHAHYLARRMEAYAEEPGGARRTLLVIPEWDFNWQSDFRFMKPVALKAGTKLAMRWTFDNSTNNFRNPHQPPVRVKFGLQTTDEMAELWMQLLPRTEAGRRPLEDLATMRTLKSMAEMAQARLRENPQDTEAMAQFAKVDITLRNYRRAEPLLRHALSLQRGSDDLHYHLGVVLLETGRTEEAEFEFLETLRLNPQHGQARNNAGLAALRMGRREAAAGHFREALRLNPRDEFARRNLELLNSAASPGPLRP